MDNKLARLKEHLEKNAGKTGIKIFQASVAKVKMGEKPSSEQINKLIKEVEKTLVLFFGKNRATEILDKLDIEYGEEKSLIDSELRQALDDIFTTKGIPSESDILEISGYITAKSNNSEYKPIDILKQLSRKKVLSALNYNIIRYEVRRFVDKYPSFTMADIELFMGHIINKNIDVTMDVLLDFIEKERLYRRFEEKNQEDTWQEKISMQYIALLNSDKSREYEYLMIDEGLTEQVLKNIRS